MSNLFCSSILTENVKLHFCDCYQYSRYVNCLIPLITRYSFPFPSPRYEANVDLTVFTIWWTLCVALANSVNVDFQRLLSLTQMLAGVHYMHDQRFVFNSLRGFWIFFSFGTWFLFLYKHFQLLGNTNMTVVKTLNLVTTLNINKEIGFDGIHHVTRCQSSVSDL